MERAFTHAFRDLLAATGWVAALGAPALGQGITEVIDHSGDQIGNTLEGSTDVVVDLAGNVFIGAQQSHNVFRIASDGTITEVLDENAGGVGPVRGIQGLTLDRDGNLYLVGRFTHNAFRLAPDGTVTRLITFFGDGINQLGHPQGTAVDSAGNVYVTGSGTDNVFRITPAGEITQILDASGGGVPNGLDFPVGIGVDSQDNLYVAGYVSANVIRRAPDGTVTQVLDASGDGMGSTLLGPLLLDIDRFDNVYVTGRHSDNVFRISSARVVDKVLDVLDPNQVIVDRQGNLFVTSIERNLVVRATPGGRVTTLIDALGAGPGAPLDWAWGVAVQNPNTVFVTGMLTDNAFRIDLPVRQREIRRTGSSPR